MIVEQIFTDNAYRNFNYLIACPETGETLAIDPLESKLCLDRAKDKGWEITQVLNTHEHGDHTGGNAAVIAATGAKLLAHAGAKDTIPGIDVGLAAGDTVKVGRSVEIEVLDTPGHTRSHVCLRSHGDTPPLLCGDTLFNAGAGNCHSGGHPALRSEAPEVRREEPPPPYGRETAAPHSSNSPRLLEIIPQQALEALARVVEPRHHGPDRDL